MGDRFPSVKRGAEGVEMLPLASGLNPPKSMKSRCLALTFDEAFTLPRAFFARVKGAHGEALVKVSARLTTAAHNLLHQPSGWHFPAANSLPAHLGLGSGIVSGSERFNHRNHVTTEGDEQAVGKAVEGF